MVSEPLLERSTWDFLPDANGDLAICTGDYAVAQQAACECKLFLGEAWYDTAQGIPFDQDILGQQPNLSLVQSLMASAAMKVPTVTAATCTLSFSRSARELTGAVYLTTESGVSLVVNV